MENSLRTKNKKGRRRIPGLTFSLAITLTVTIADLAIYPGDYSSRITGRYFDNDRVGIPDSKRGKTRYAGLGHGILGVHHSVWKFFGIGSFLDLDGSLDLDGFLVITSDPVIPAANF